MRATPDELIRNALELTENLPVLLRAGVDVRGEINRIAATLSAALERMAESAPVRQQNLAVESAIVITS